MRYLILSLPIALAACATTGSSGGRIAIDTVSGKQPLPGTTCVVSTNGGRWNVVTPGTVMVGGTNGDLHVVCNKSGYRTSEMIFQPSGPYGSSMGLGVGGGGGHVGVGVGLNVPISIGGGGYPSRVTVDLQPQ
jgi:hypothetical protein